MELLAPTHLDGQYYKLIRYCASYSDPPYLHGGRLGARGKALSRTVINPRRACTARITVNILSFCLSVCLSVTTFFAATSNKTANNRYEWVQCHTGFILKNSVFCKKNVAFESYCVEQSEEANMQISTGLPRLALRTLEAPEVAMQGKR